MCIGVFCMAMASLKFILLLGVSLFVVGCANESGAPVTNAWNDIGTTQTEHAVQPGETIYSIAWRYNLSDQDLIQWNHLEKPYYVNIGQVIRLTPPPGFQAPVPVEAAPAFTPLASTESAKSATPVTPAGTGTWNWPVKGKIIESYGQNGNKGIDLAVRPGTEVTAVQEGTVVYAGNSLHGYGELLIIKQKNDLMTAYAHNSKLLVHEGSKITQGQVIAQSGDTEAKQAMLHFEVRKAGKPVDPMAYLKPQGAL